MKSGLATASGTAVTGALEHGVTGDVQHGLGEPQEPLYLTAEQVADMLQVDAKTVSRWSLEDASMPVLRRGRVVRFPRERLMAWLERQEPRTSRRAARASREAAKPRPKLSRSCCPVVLPR